MQVTYNKERAQLLRIPVQWYMIYGQGHPYDQWSGAGGVKQWEKVKKFSVVRKRLTMMRCSGKNYEKVPWAKKPELSENTKFSQILACDFNCL